MRRKCRDMVAYARTFGWSGPPYCPKILAGIHDVIVEDTDEAFDGEGRIFPRRGQVVIQVKKGATPERRRFTICHELAHTCFRDAYEFTRHHGSASDEGEHKRFENLCDVGAAELLMPHEDFMADLRLHESTMAKAILLSGRYNASIDAILRRLVPLTSHDCAAVFLTDESFKDHASVAGGLRIKSFVRSPSFAGFLPPGTLLPSSSVAHSATHASQSPFPDQRETWTIEGKAISWYVEALRLPVFPNNKEYPKVVALLHSQTPHRHGC